MSLTLVRDGLDVDLDRRVARGKFIFDSRTDLPERGTSVSWVQFGGDAIGGGWVVDKLQLKKGVFFEAEITARQPGYNWTWCDGSGNPLTPIARRGKYRLVPGTQVNGDGDVELGYWNVFTNWPSASSWTVDEIDPLTDQLKTWEIEFVSTSQYSEWLYHKNGTWATGLTPPVATVGAYKCMGMEIAEEIYTDPVDGTAGTYYRHFAVFWEAPVVGATTLTWNASAW